MGPLCQATRVLCFGNFSPRKTSKHTLKVLCAQAKNTAGAVNMPLLTQALRFLHSVMPVDNLPMLLAQKPHLQVCSTMCIRRMLALQRGLVQPAASRSYGRPQVRCQCSTADAPKAALMVVGDEILKGSITDTNTPWLASLLHARGVDLVRVEYVPDDEDDIAATAVRLRQRVGASGFVFTSGGIGPTHDDVTYQSLAKAFGVKLELHEPTVERMRDSYAKRGMDLNEARLRMATLPTPSEVLFTPGTWVPLVNLQGVYILPGIPKLFQSMITANQERFTGRAYVSHTLYSVPGESFIADQLTEIAKAHTQVAIGSYPNVDSKTEGAWKVRLALNSRDSNALEAAVAELKLKLPHLLEQPPGA